MKFYFPLVFFLLTPLCWGNASASKLADVLALADPTETLSAAILKQTLIKITPLENEATIQQQQHINMLKIRYYAIQGEYESAMLLIKALEHESIPNEYRVRLYSLGLQVFNISGDYVAAFSYLNKAQKMLKWSDSPHQKHHAVVAASSLFLKAKMYKESITLAEQGLAWAHQSNNLADLTSAWGYLAEALRYSGQPVKAEQAYNSQLKYAGEASLPLFEGAAYAGLGSIYYSRRLFEESLSFNKQAMTKFMAANYLPGMLEVEVDMVSNYMALNKPHLAQQELSRIERDYEIDNAWEVLENIYEIKEQLAQQKNDYVDAYNVLKKKIEFSAILMDEQKAILIAHNRATFNAKAQELEITLLKQQAELSDLAKQADVQEIKNNRLVILGAALILLFLGYMWYRAQQQKAHFCYLSEMDGLTNLYNHKTSYEEGKQVFYQCQKEDLPITMVIADIDKFKLINDNFGHATGDEVILAVADKLKALAGKNTIVGRTGGDEFSVLYPGKTADEVVERFRGFINKSHSITHFGRDVEYSLSFGIAERSEKETLLSLLIAVADDALYEAKSKGRNGLKVYNEKQAEYWRTRRS